MNANCKNKNTDMALNKRKSRPINVKGIDYRWQFFEDSGFNSISIQSVQGNGQKLVVFQSWSHAGTPYISTEDPVTPRDIRFMIEFGLANGWEPNKGGKPFSCWYSKSGGDIRNMEIRN